MEKLLYIGIIVLIVVILAIGITMMVKKNNDNNDNIIQQQINIQESHNNSLYQENKNDSNIAKDIDLEKINIEIDENTISNTGITLIITDNNEENLSWAEGYKIQRKMNGDWVELEPNNELISPAISHWKDENNQYKQQINWSYYYGELKNGKYRIVKPKYNPKNNSYMDLYSEEFEISQ